MVLKQSSKRTHGRQKMWLMAAIIVLIAGGLAIGLHITQHSKGTSSIQTGGQAAYNNAKKEATQGNGGQPVSDSNLSGNKGAIPSDSYTPPTTNSGITVTPSQSGSNVIITTKLIGYSDGTCTLTIANGSKTTTQRADVIFAPSYSSCAGFLVPKNSVGNGTWNITLSVLSGGVSTSKSVTFEVSP